MSPILAPALTPSCRVTSSTASIRSLTGYRRVSPVASARVLAQPLITSDRGSLTRYTFLPVFGFGSGPFEIKVNFIDPDGDEAGRSFHLAVPRFLDALDRVGARAPFFMIGRDARDPGFRAAVREIAARGHEVGNHSQTHPYNFARLGRAEKEQEIARCEQAIADLLGERPVGFRTPSGDVDRETQEILVERGYLYDASLIPSPLMWVFMLYGKLFVKREDYQLGRLRYALAPPWPYLPRRDKLYRPLSPASSAAPHLVEIPTTVVRWLGMPFYATLLRMLGPWSFDLLVRLHGRRRPITMLLHLIDLVDHGDSSLAAALARTPGLDVPIERREDFVDHVFARLADLGDAVPLRELAADYPDQNGLQRAA